MADLDKTLRQKFFHRQGGMFITQQEAIDDPHIRPAHGRQNKRKGTMAKHKRKIAEKSRKKNRRHK